MRHIYILCLTLFSLSSYASHMWGADISWECVGNNQYVFIVDQHVDCSSVQTTGQSLNGPTGTLALTYMGSTSISLCGSNACRARFKTVPVTLTGTPPPSGWEFTYQWCCSAPAVNIASSSTSIKVKARMYSNGGNNCVSSPEFISNPQPSLTTFNKLISCMAQSPYVEDSLYYRFSNITTNSSPVTYHSGYSYSSPFPSSTTDPSNGSVIMHSALGFIETDIQSATSGAYNYAVVVEQWRNQVLIGEVERMTAVSGSFGGSSNQIPSVDIDTSLYKGVARAGQVYNIEAFPGDTVDFEMVATDSDFNTSTSQYQLISFMAQGSALDTLWNGIANYSSKPTLNPVGAQTGYASQLTNRINFNWIIKQEHVGTPHLFHFQFVDDSCYTPGVAHIFLTVNVKNGTHISADTSLVCEGDSVMLLGLTSSGTYQWSPSNGLSSTSVATPQASPASSQYYYLEDPQNPGFKDSVYVDVTPVGSFSFSFNNGQLELADSAQTTSRTWYYNGIPFAYPYDTLTPFGLGDYYVIATNKACKYISDTVSITSGMSFSVSSTGNGGFNGTILPVTGSLGVTFQVNQNVNVSSVSIPGISDLFGKTGGYDLKLQVFDNTQAEIFKKDVTLQRPIDDVLTIEGQFSLNANSKYTIVVSGDTGYAFSFYENVQLPATPHNTGITVTSITEGAHGQFPATPSVYLLPISMGIDKMVDIDESILSKWEMYPNPATAEVTLSGLSDVQTVELMEVNGKIIRSFLVKKNQQELKIEKAGLPAGLYFVKVYSGNTTSLKKVLFQ